jgi:hypothetical protein
MRAIRSAITAALLVCLTGCPVPIVRYDVADADAKGTRSPDLEGKPKFKLASSLLVFKAEGDTPKTVKISSKPVEEAKNVTYMIVDATAAGVKSNLQVKHKDNSMLIESITTQLEDNRLKLVQGIGGVIGSIVGLGKGGDVSGVPDDFSASVRLHEYFASKSAADRISLTDGDLKPHKNFSHTNYSVDAVIGAIPADATPRSSYPTTTDQRTLIYSACRTATVKITVGGSTFEGTVKVADPNFIQTVGIPPKGSITMHSECGVSVTSEPVETTSTTDLFQEIIKQFKAVMDK